MDKHTKTPWKWADGWDGYVVPDREYQGEKYRSLQLLGKNGEEVIPMRVDHYNLEFDCHPGQPPISEADRKLIVRAVNNHEALLLAAKNFVAWADECWGSWAINDKGTPKAKADYEAAKAAIAAAESESK